MNRIGTLCVACSLLASVGYCQAQTPHVVYARSAKVSYEKNVEIPAPANGLISELLVEEGKYVVKDEVLINLDQRIAKAEYEVAMQESIAAQRQAEDNSNILYANKVAEVSTAEYENYLERSVKARPAPPNYAAKNWKPKNQNSRSTSPNSNKPKTWRLRWSAKKK